MSKEKEIRTIRWMCNEATLVAGYGIVRPGAVLEFEEGSEPDIVKNGFRKLTDDEVNFIEVNKSSDNDLTLQIMKEKLRDMKVRIPRGSTADDIRELFKSNVADVELQKIV